MEDGDRFSILLQKAISRIAHRKSKRKQIVYDELGYAIGREGGSPLQYWAYHRAVPANLNDLEELTRAIAENDGWEDPADLEQFLKAANHPYPERLCREIFPPGPPGNTKAAENDEPPPDDDRPFTVGPPILQPHRFFGRETEVRRIFELLDGQQLQHIAISGPQRCGKTSLLHYLRKLHYTQRRFLRPGQKSDWLRNNLNLRWVFIDFQDPRNLTQAGFFDAVLTQLSIEHPAACTLRDFINLICTHLVQPIVILLDEVQIPLQMLEFDQVFWWSLRSLGSNLTNGRLGFILSAQNRPETLTTYSEQPSPFLNIFGYHFPLGPLRQEEAHQLILSAPQPFDPADINWILEQSHGWPILVQILCQQRWQTLQTNPDDPTWKENALQAMRPYAHLLQKG